MHKALAMLVCLLPSRVLLAHALDADAGLAARLSHQVASAHHWPLLLLLLCFGLALLRFARRHAARAGSAGIRSRGK